MLAPLAALAGRRWHPTAISGIAFACGIACTALLAAGIVSGALVFWAANRLLDGLDGAVARRQGRQTDLGGYLDMLLDMVIYAIVPIAAAVAAPQSATLWLALACLLASFYVNAGSWMFLSAILEKRAAGERERREETSVTFPPGLVEGVETMILFTLFILLPAHLTALFWLAALLIALTAAQRLVWAVRRL